MIVRNDIITEASLQPQSYLGNMLAIDAGSSKSYPGSGDLWYDLSGNNNTVHLQNSPAFDGNEGFITFNGTDQYGVAYHNDTLNAVGNSMTIETWVRRGAGTDAFIVSKAPYTGGPNNQNGNYSLWAYWNAGDNTNLYFISNDGSDNINYAYGNSIVSTSTTDWFQYVCVFNNGVWKFFRNGSLYTSSIGYGPVNMKSTTEDLLIGRRKDGASNLDGDLAIVNIFDYALSDNDVKSNFNFYRSRFSI